ncbi:Metal ion ABC transporter, permease protein [Alteracholeplasma palmae J233]|uniref:Metal ion ABC transporter, permease protein n=1 Tax=Alteracholeplasma palmae (strain ATCC 49389 / J233) TaxID=1318466 RepID=U4KRG4_ALTPJ|nr:metal ABC transporter permease [Alteracholeplasma palmae]CCV64141.1 Metal ion ABC transporter, permease protein [Alteracholeplasma palmae J233]
MFDFITNYTVRTVLIGAVLLGIVSGVLGVFTLLRKQALIGDAISHATLPGVVLAFIFTKQTSLEILLLGAAFASVISMGLIALIKKYSKVKYDASLALILSSFFGFGQLLLSIIRDTAGQDQAKLSKFIFGQAATMSTQDIYILMGVLIIVLVVIVVFWRHLKLYIFNQEYYQSLGFKGYLINILISMMTILVIVSGIQTVGVILMSSLLIAPGVAASQWSDKLKIQVLLAGLFGAIASFIGVLVSTNMATGPSIVVVASIIVILSLLIAPKKGILWKEYKMHQHKKQINQYKELIHIYEEKEINEDKKNGLTLFIEEGYLDYHEGKYSLTPKGKQKVLALLTGEL